MAAKLGLDFSEFEALKERLTQIPSKSEEALNRVIHTEGVKIIEDKITNRLPVSKVRKKHAKGSKPFKATPSNLAIEIKPKPKFRYLVFPNLGLGNKNKTAYEFMEQGLQDATKPILEKLNKEVDNIINE
ncbi:hypothetical protein [Listeria fleischmannii]|uniref:Gp9 protein n=1 Tax=Listeria fleischmannii FSL S10-1203 TaxID=1265822 RepID=W7DYP0_9LIST|nr:hypothetical protein [Listeria fleischmannii]EUJ56628.1 Gp9 protein [Listeria fleischmannii FSL S10-1203]